ncbi:putative cysteine-rich secretory protein [Chloropicon primus]|nr:putative cysteine-rich secretory protein [Chloropicon primus]
MRTRRRTEMMPRGGVALLAAIAVGLILLQCVAALDTVRNQRLEASLRQSQVRERIARRRAEAQARRERRREEVEARKREVRRKREARRHTWPDWGEFEEPPSAGVPQSEHMGLDLHNELRSLHGAPALEWSDAVAASAQEWADKLAAEGCDLVHDMDSGYGENLAKGHESLDLAIQDWYDEVRWYNHRRARFSERTGHYTQLVWMNSENVGCAQATCHDDRFGRKIFVCRYDPPGNFHGHFAENEWANHLANNRNCNLEHSTYQWRNSAGENLASGFGSMDQAVQGWYDEVCLYNHVSGGFGTSTGHYTQMVWADTTRLGCAQVVRSGCRMYVCHYGPAGNFAGQFQQNVHEPYSKNC